MITQQQRSTKVSRIQKTSSIPSNVIKGNTELRNSNGRITQDSLNDSEKYYQQMQKDFELRELLMDIRD